MRLCHFEILAQLLKRRQVESGSKFEANLCASSGIVVAAAVEAIDGKSHVLACPWIAVQNGRNRA